MSRFGRKLLSQIDFLRQNFRNDGAEGETVHAVANAAKSLLAERELLDHRRYLEGRRDALRDFASAARIESTSQAGVALTSAVLLPIARAAEKAADAAQQQLDALPSTSREAGIAPATGCKLSPGGSTR